MTIKEANVTINVKDMDTSVSFYQSLGLDVKNRWGNFYAQLAAPGIVIGLVLRVNPLATTPGGRRLRGCALLYNPEQGGDCRAWQ